MREWLESVLGADLATPVVWIMAAAILAVVLYVLVRVARVLTSGTFVVGGRNRKPRLSVMDAAAVDARRRLVLVRRDDVEHLILIGGPTDVVVESNIQLIQRPRTASADAETTRPPWPQEEQALQTTRPPQPAGRTKPPQPMPAPLPPIRQPVASPTVARSASTTPPRPTPAPAPAPAPAMPTAPSAAAPVRTQPPSMPRATPVAVPPPASATDGVASFRRAPDAAPRPAGLPGRDEGKSELDSALIDELEASLDDKVPPPVKPKAESSIQDEMARLLGSLSREKRQ